jgi:serine/threonine-protein kinase HipA
MVFNAAFGNTDDHLKNFWMVRDDAGYRLSEAFDLLPDVGERREHCLAFQYGYGVPTGTELRDVARRWGVPDADDAIAAVLSSTGGFAATAQGHDVPPANIKAIAEDLARRRARLET